MNQENYKTYLKQYHEEICSLPHRAAGTENEKKAAKIMKEQYEKMGLEAKYVDFKIYKDSFFRHAFTVSFIGLLLVLSVALKLKPAICLAILAIELLIHLRNPIDINKIMKHFSKTKARVVYTKLEAQGEKKLTLVILGHYDTVRRTLFVKHYANLLSFLLAKQFKENKRWKHLHLKMLPFIQGPYLFLNLIILSSGLLTVLRLLGFEALLLTIPVLIFDFTFILLGNFYALHGLFSPYVNGAFDNGSGTAMVVALAKYFSEHKPENIELYFVNNSAEETYTRTIAPFADYMKFDKRTTLFIPIDAISSEVLIAGSSECDDVGFNVNLDKNGYAFVQKFINSTEYQGQIWEGYIPFSTDATMLVKSGYRVMFTLDGNETDGFPDQYHQMTDTIEKTNYETMDLAFRFMRDLVESVDKEGYKEI